MSFRDAVIFLFNTVSGIIFAALALFVSPGFWPFLANPILAVLCCVLAFRDEWRKHPEKTWRRTTMMMIPRVKSRWSTGGAVLYLYFYAVILLYPAALSVAVLLSIWCIVDTYSELGKLLARVALKRRMKDLSGSED